VKVAIHQPQYFPWPPYVHKVMSADIFVYLDTVQFSKNGLQNRNQIKTPQGPQWLTIPVKQHLGQRLLGTTVADSHASTKHWKTLLANYARTVGFARWRNELQSLLEEPSELLTEVTIASTEWMLDKMSVAARRVRASEIAHTTGEASRLIASICNSLKADSYLTGTGALAYINPSDFSAIGCHILVQQWKPFTYKQAHPEIGFVPDLSSLDLLLNCPDEAAGLITSAGSWTALQTT